MPEKMTPERLGKVLAWMGHRGGPGFADELRAHIAALEAERDEARSLKATDARDEEKRSVEQWAERADLAERAAAALRQRAGSDEAEEVGRAEWERMLEARQEAATAFYIGCRAALRYVVGEDATGVARAPEPGSNMADVFFRRLNRLNSPPAASTAGRIPEPDPLCGACGGSGVEPGTVEPTTAEAFATVRKGVFAARDTERYLVQRGHASDGSVEQAVEEALAATDLLERRMGAQESVLRHLSREEGMIPGYAKELMRLAALRQ